MLARSVATPARVLRRQVIENWRGEGIHGGRISRHRALLRHRFPSIRWLSVLALPVSFTSLLVLAVPMILQCWSSVLSWAIGLTQVPAQLTSTNALGGLRLPVEIAWLDLDAGAPSPTQWWGCAIATLVASLATLRLPSRMLPVVYVVRVYAIVLAASLAYFVLMPNRFTYSLSDHVAMLMVMILLLSLLVPWVFALTYNILAFELSQKIALSLCGVGFLILFAPFLAFSHALILHYGSLLFQPMLFLLLGLFPPMMVLVALYSWAMTWQRRAQ